MKQDFLAKHKRGGRCPSKPSGITEHGTYVSSGKLRSAHHAFYTGFRNPFPSGINMLKRMVTKPKLHFYDCGLVAYLTKWSDRYTLMSGAMSGAILGNFVVSEIVKSYQNCGREPFIYYYRDKDTKEIDILL